MFFFSTIFNVEKLLRVLIHEEFKFIIFRDKFLLN